MIKKFLKCGEVLFEVLPIRQLGLGEDGRIDQAGKGISYL